MEFSAVMIFSLKFLIPSFFSMLFRAVGLGHRGFKRVAVGFAVFIAYLLIVPSILINYMGYGEYTHIAGFVMIWSGAAVLIFSSDPPAKTIFLHLIQANLITVISAVCNMVRHLMGWSYFTLLFLLLFVSAATFTAAMRFCKKPIRFMADAIQTDWNTLIATSFMTIALAMIFPIYPARNFESHPIFCTIMMVGIELCFFLYVYVLYRNLRKISELSENTYQQKSLDKTVDAMRAELAAREELLFHAKTSRHDLRHHNALILEYLENGDMVGAKDYLRVYDSCISETALSQYCKNPVANAMLRMYVRMAEAEGIVCTVATEIPDTLPLSEQEICILFGNLLENACNACRKADKSIVRTLSVSATVTEFHLRLEIQNTAAGTVHFDGDGLPIPHRSGSGVGTRSVAKMLADHKDHIKFSQEDGIFAAQVMIHL